MKRAISCSPIAGQWQSNEKKMCSLTKEYTRCANIQPRIAQLKAVCCTQTHDKEYVYICICITKSAIENKNQIRVKKGKR